MEYILDTDKWRCGGNVTQFPEGRLGEGETSLLNEEGYMCCLGQFAEQAGVPLNRMLHVSIPQLLTPPNCTSGSTPSFLTDTEHAWLFESIQVSPNSLRSKCIRVNDSKAMTVKEKIAELSKILKYNGHTLRVIGTAHLEEA